MADIFEQKNAVELLQNKNIVFLGDSNLRYLYKDLIWLLNHNSLTPSKLLKRKGEKSHEGDRLVGPCYLVTSRDYKEIRQYDKKGFSVHYSFITRCLNEQVENYLREIKNKTLPAPDVIVMNSTLWDLTRWGPDGVKQFKLNLVKLMKLLNQSLPEKTMFIWTTALPPGKNIRKGSLLIKQVEFLEHTVRFDVMEANLYAKNVVVEYGYDVLDLHYHLRMQIHRRTDDGLHYQSLPTRLLTNILLTHIALSWGHPLPKNVSNSALNRYIEMVCDNEDKSLNNESNNVISDKPNNSTPNNNGANKVGARKKKRARRSASRQKNWMNGRGKRGGKNRASLPYTCNQPPRLEPFNSYNDLNYNPMQQDRLPPHIMDMCNYNQLPPCNEPFFFYDDPPLNPHPWDNFPSSRFDKVPPPLMEWSPW